MCEPIPVCPLNAQQVRQAQQMATLIGKRKSELTAKLDRLNERRDTLLQQLNSSSSAGAAAGSASGKLMLMHDPY